MQIAVTALMAALAAKASAAPAGPAIMSVSHFDFTCVEHGGTCTYNFELDNSATGNTGGVTTAGVKCSKSVPVTLAALPAVTDGTCENSPHSWTVADNGDGTFTLAATLSGPGSDTGSHVIHKEELQRQDHTSAGMTYKGQDNFLLIKQN